MEFKDNNVQTKYNGIQKNKIKSNEHTQHNMNVRFNSILSETINVNLDRNFMDEEY